MSWLVQAASQDLTPGIRDERTFFFHSFNCEPERPSLTRIRKSLRLAPSFSRDVLCLSSSAPREKPSDPHPSSPSYRFIDGFKSSFVLCLQNSLRRLQPLILCVEQQSWHNWMHPSIPAGPRDYSPPDSMRFPLYCCYSFRKSLPKDERQSLLIDFESCTR